MKFSGRAAPCGPNSHRPNQRRDRDRGAFSRSRNEKAFPIKTIASRTRRGRRGRRGVAWRGVAPINSRKHQRGVRIEGAGRPSMNIDAAAAVKSKLIK